MPENLVEAIALWKTPGAKVRVGMTGTRNPITGAQLNWAAGQLARASALEHGACVGADEELHHLAVCFPGLPITVHPPEDERLMMPREKWAARSGIVVMPARGYHARNRDIVDNTARLIALPDGPERKQSGTWYTVRYAVQVAKKPVLICYPDGRIEAR